MVHSAASRVLVSVAACLALTTLLLPAGASASNDGSQAVGLKVSKVSTDDGRLYARSPNQGWWSDRSVASSGNFNYVAGRCCDSAGAEYRNFFSFDLSSTKGRVVFAKLKVYTNVITAPDTHTYGLFDVHTPAAVVNRNNGRDADIFEDLGTGTSYGTYTISRDQEQQWVTLTLNRAAVKDINAAGDGYFTVGGRLLSLDDRMRDQYLYGFSGDRYAHLILRTTPSAS